GKPFVLPQKDPDLYGRMLESYNIPELVTGRIMMNPRDFEKVSGNQAIIAISGDIVQTFTTKTNTGNTGRPVHE
ncbi:MAG TPA: hypothetical protein VHO68_05055, partial [Bacteroidales bacterium]|nr:hypothetical protein [Bacteroidales bacterium]